MAAAVAARSGASHLVSPLVNEGGGIHVDGEGTVLVTETVQLDPGRNPGLSKADVEAELARTLGASHVVWLPRGLTRDSERFGTRGHVDIVAAIPSPGTVLVHSQQNPAHPDFEVSRDIISHLATTRDAAGRDWNIIEVPAPETLTRRGGFRRLQLHQPPGGQRRRHRLHASATRWTKRPCASSATPTPAAG